MSEQHINVDSDEYLGTPQALRDAYKKAVADLKQVAQERDAYKGQATSAALSGVLREFKNPERVQRDLLGDGVDPLDSAAVSRWMTDNGDDYAKGAKAPAPSSTPNASDEEAAAHQRLQNSGDLTSPADMTSLQSALTDVGENPTGAELIEAYRKRGV